MDHNNRLDEVKTLINALLSDAQTLHCDVFDQRSKTLTYRKVCKRLDREGLSFLTKTLPRLGKALDRALTGEVPMNSAKYAFKSMPNSQLPQFCGELFQCIFSHDGQVLLHPDVSCIRTVRTLLYYFYKYQGESYSPKQEQKVISQFIKTEDDIQPYDKTFKEISDRLEANYSLQALPFISPDVDHILTKNKSLTSICKEAGITLDQVRLIRRARRLLNEVFQHFDPMSIHPKHGPGAVSSKEKLWGKYFWSNIPDRIASVYPIDAYYYASNGHICDSLSELQTLRSKESFARVLLVPKDSRGPRLISCEPLEFQWIQQGLGGAIVRHIERHPLTRYNVHFTDQHPNQCGALLGSSTGRYATLDLKEASDRVSVGLVRLLFPSKVLPYLLACRSLGTVLPDGSELTLRKFAPMGSALCFPIMALTIWAIITAGIDDADAREGVLVYGDDIVLPTAFAASSVQHLESFGLQVNRDKSCTTGSFRESCGVDAFNGTNVTPLRLRKALYASPSPDSFTSNVAHCNALWERKFENTYWFFANRLFRDYGQIPSKEMSLTSPSLYSVPDRWLPTKKRFNPGLQKLEWKVLDVSTRQIKKNIDGWRMLLRYFAEATHDHPLTNSLLTQHGFGVVPRSDCPSGGAPSYEGSEPFSVSSYTKRGDMKMSRRWR